LIARLAAAAGAGVAALIVVAVALWYLGQSAMLGLEMVPLAPPIAALLVGVGGLLLALVIAGIAKAVARPGRPAHAPAPARSGSAVADAAAQLGGMMAQQVVSATRTRPYTTLGAALAAGLVVGALPELRGLIGGLLKR
jgi:hypothetical protein